MLNFMPAIAPPTCRNKGIICKNYFTTKKCPLLNCPYAHIAEGETQPVPDAICLFYQQNKCLRESCKFFHGSRQDFGKLRSSGSATYRPQDMMPVETPPSESPQAVMIPLVAPLPQQQPFLPNNAEGGFLVPPPPPPPAPQQHQPLYLHHQQTTMNSHIPPPQHHYFAQQSQQVQQVSSQQAYFVQAPPLQPTLLPQPSQSAVSVSHHLVMGPNGQLFQLQQQPPPGVSYATAPSAGQQPQPQQQHDTILWI